MLVIIAKGGQNNRQFWGRVDKMPGFTGILKFSHWHFALDFIFMG